MNILEVGHASRNEVRDNPFEMVGNPGFVKNSRKRVGHDIEKQGVMGWPWRRPHLLCKRRPTSSLIQITIYPPEIICIIIWMKAGTKPLRCKTTERNDQLTIS